METLSDVRKAIAPFGMTLKTKTFSFGRSASYCEKDAKHPIGDVFSPETYARLNPFLEWREQNKETLKRVGKNEGVTGLW
jgi:hypothetical protein